MPAAARANHGAATISVKVSDTSVRQTKLDQSGCSPARIGSDDQPLRDRRSPGRDRARREHDRSGEKDGPERSDGVEQGGECEEHDQSDPARHEHGHDPAELPQRSRDAQPRRVGR